PGALVEGMEEMIRRAVGPHIEMTVSAEADLWPVLVDPHQLENALLNLCINARDAMPEGGSLGIAASNKSIAESVAGAWDIPPGRYVVIQVSDTGSGMSPEIVDRVFEPFFTTKPLGMGTGLGLSMVYGFAKQSGGLVRIHSKVGVGTSVSIYLPQHHQRPEAETPSSEQSVPATGRGETVLIVDDEPAVRTLMVEVLQELGYYILEAGDAASALALLRTHPRVDLLVTDVGLPGGMNGRQLADAARVDQADLPVLFVTGYSVGALGEQLPEGMHIITKPFDMGTLARRARELTQR
ncbi:MAG: response regulator, partial [Alcaligenaceae bacterium]